jgi:RHS repeat-associated protein
MIGCSPLPHSALVATDAVGSRHDGYDGQESARRRSSLHIGNPTHVTRVKNVDPLPTCCVDDPADADTLNEVTTKYDARHRPIARTVWLAARGSVDENNPPIAGDNGVPAADGLTTRWRYDDDLTDVAGIDFDYAAQLGGLNFGAGAVGYAVETTNPKGETAVVVYDSVGRIVRTVDGNRNSTSAGYALVNKNLAFSFGGYTAPLLDTTVTDALGHAMQTLTSAQGRTLFSIDAEARQTTFEYDANGSLTQFRDPNATGYDCVYDERNRKLSCTDRRNATTSQAYDAQSNVITMTDGLNHSSHCVYDARNRKTSCTDRINGVTNYTYDANSNLATISDADAVAGNTGKQTVYTYDPRNLLATETYPDNGVKSFVFDGANRLVSRLDQKNDTVSYLYDFANRMTSRHYPDGQDDTFTFDAASRLLTAASARYNNVVTRTYDPASRLLSEIEHINGVDYPVAYGYDAANRQTNVTYPDGKVLSRTFTNRDQLATAAFDGGNVLTRTYDIGMRQDQTTYGNSIVEFRRYQIDNLIAQINTTGNQVKWVYDLGDGYDANKRNTFAADFNLGVYEYVYDNEDRLTSNFDQGVGVTQTWVLSLVGDWNSFTKNAVTETRTHDAAHELLTRNATSLTYDQKGNLTQHSNGQQYTWDYENRMQTAVNALAVQVGVYTYDALGRRVSKVTTAGTTVFVSDGLQEIAEYDNAAAVNAPTREYVFGSYIDEPLMMLTAGARYYYHSDRLYSVQALTNAAGQIVERYRYDAYGNTTILAPNGTTVRASSIVGNAYMWQGSRLDAETGLYYKRMRMYSAELGRFITRDPLEYIDGYSMYSGYFVPNGVDPLGLGEDCNCPRRPPEPEPLEPPAPRPVVPTNGFSALSSFPGHVANGALRANYIFFGTFFHEIESMWGGNRYKDAFDVPARWGGKLRKLFDSRNPAADTADEIEVAVVNHFRELNAKVDRSDYAAAVTQIMDDALLVFGMLNRAIAAAEAAEAAETAALAEKGLNALSMDGQMAIATSGEAALFPGTGLDPVWVMLMEGAGGFRCQGHHKVPYNNKSWNHENHPLVKQAKVNLKDYNKNLMDLINHGGRHTDAYHMIVDHMLTSAYETVAGGSQEAALNALNEVLEKIAQDVKSGKLRPYDSKSVWAPGD